MQLNKYVSRYVLPFYFKYDNNDYEEICKKIVIKTKENLVCKVPKDGKWKEIGFWEDYKFVNNDSQPEMELYSYLLSVFKENRLDNKKDLTNLGKSFVYTTTGTIFDAQYQNKKDGGEEEWIPFECKDFGIIILKNGVGFMWYEIIFRKNPTVACYKNFQHDFKELARTHTTKFRRKIDFDEVSKKARYETFCIGEWISEFMNIEGFDIHFWAERRKGSSTTSQSQYLPDKALLFQYLFTEDVSKEQRNELAFHVANGYDEKYKMPVNMEEIIYSPFGNSTFYISKAGMSCVVSNQETNEEFFSGQFREKYVRDYFFMYLLLCYQTYSCAHYSRLLTKLPAEEAMFGKKKSYSDKLEAVNGQVNLFLVKSVFDSVSTVHHQNEVYRYGKKSLSINEDIQSLTIGLEALRDIEREKRDRKLNSAISIFGLLVVVSTLLDGFNLVDWVDMNCFGGNMSAKELVYIVVAGVVIFIAINLVVALVRNHNKTK